MNPKHKALELSNRDEIIEAYNNSFKAQPDKNKIRLLINTFNDVHNSDVITIGSYYSCGDCRRSVKHFWKYIIEKWQKT